MSFQTTAALLEFFDNIDYLIIIAVRFFGFFMLMPVFSGASIPTRLKLALALVVSYMIFSAGNITGLVYDPTNWGYFIILLIEFLTGFILAFSVYIVFTTFFLAGQIIDYEIGFAMVNVLDPLTQIQVPITANIIYLMTMFMLVHTGGLHDIIAAFAHSYAVIPIGGAFVLSSGALMQNAVDSIITFYIMGLRIAMPIMGTILVINVSLGLLVKASPQMNIFVVGMPIKLFIGLLLFFTVVPGYYYVYNVLLADAIDNILSFMEALVIN